MLHLNTLHFFDAMLAKGPERAIVTAKLSNVQPCAHRTR